MRITGLALSWSSLTGGAEMNTQARALLRKMCLSSVKREMYFLQRSERSFVEKVAAELGFEN